VNLEQPAADPRHWNLDPRITFLNHGSFGATPRVVLQHQQELREQIEREPVRFYVDDLEHLWDDARRELARFLGARADDLVFVPNATTGVNAVSRSLKFRRGDELLVTDHEYNACRNALNFVAAESGATVKVAKLPFPVRSSEELISAVLAAVTKRTRLALLDHVTSQTALVMPIGALTRELESRGVMTLVDGAHAPGMVECNLQKLGAAFYTGNCHKWICAPKGTAFIHVRSDLQKLIRPVTISHGANSARRDRSRFLLEFGWMGTADHTAALSVGTALRCMASMLPGGWREVRRRNHLLTLAARDVVCAALETTPPCPAELLGSMAAIPIRDLTRREVAGLARNPDPLRVRLLADYGIEIPCNPWPAPPKRLIRFSAQLYNSFTDYRRLAEALIELKLRPDTASDSTQE
jgi:isopenicillin-N epimerase